MTPLFLIGSSKNGIRRCVRRVPVSSLAQSTVDNNASSMAYSLSQACPVDQPQQQRWLSDAATWIPEMTPTMEEQLRNSQNQLKIFSRAHAEKDWFQQDKVARRQAYVKKLRERELLEERYRQAYADLISLDNEKTCGAL